MERQVGHWLEEIEVRDLLDCDVALIYDCCGLDVLIRLWENMQGVNLYISAKSLMAARKRYIALHYDGNNIKKLAVKLAVSEKFVQDVVAGKMSDYLPQKDQG